MKKTILLATAMLPVALFAQNKIAVDEDNLGRRFSDCIMSGSVCDFSLSDKDISNAFAYKTGENSFILEIKASALTTEQQKGVLGKELKDIAVNEVVRCSIPDDMPVEETFARALGFSGLKTIPSGLYPVKIEEDLIKIYFELNR